MIPFPNKKYSVIYADPPWSYQGKKCSGNAADHYPTMAIKDICALPVKDIAADDCVHAPIHIFAAALGRNDFGTVDGRPKDACIQLPIDGRASVVYVSAHQPLPYNADSIAVA